MAVSAAKTWSAAEVLTASELNAEYNNVVDNGEDHAWPATKAKDFDGAEMVMDADADSGILSSTDDRVDLRLQGRILFRFDGTTTTPVNGLDFTAAAASSEPSVDAVGTDTDITINLVPKGIGVIQLAGETMSGTDESQWQITRQVYG